MAKKEDRVIIHLACPECRERNYTTTKNRRNDSDRLELRKYCPRCRTHRPHAQPHALFSGVELRRVAHARQIAQ